jgi:hypothetical protein
MEPPRKLERRLRPGARLAQCAPATCATWPVATWRHDWRDVAAAKRCRMMRHLQAAASSASFNPLLARPRMMRPGFALSVELTGKAIASCLTVFWNPAR